MARRHINFDKTEIVLGFAAGKKYHVLNLSYADVQRIQFDTCTESKLFRKLPSEKITVQTGKYGEPITYTKLKHEPYWEEYKKGFSKFAAGNTITFVDNT